MSKTSFMAGVLLFALAGGTGAMPINWTLTDYSVVGDSIVGRSHTSWDTGVPHHWFTSIEVRDQQPISTVILPIPGPGDDDKLSSSVSLEEGRPDQRAASTSGNLTGDLFGAIAAFNTVGSRARNTNLLGQTIKTEAVGTTTFTGQLISTGTGLELVFDGVYSLFAFHQNQNLVFSPQRAESDLSVVLTVKNLTTSGVLISETLFSDSLVQAFFGVSHKDDELIAGDYFIDLTGTPGNTIEVILETKARATSYAHRSSWDSSGLGAAGATAGAGFNEFSFLIIPEPSTLVLLGLGMLGLGGNGWKSRPRDNMGKTGKD